MALIAYQQAKVTGTALTLSAANGGGDTMTANDRGVLVVRNGDGTSTNVTVVVPGVDKYAQARPDVVVAVAAGATTVIGPFPTDLADPADRLIDITYSKVTSLTVGAFTV